MPQGVLLALALVALVVLPCLVALLVINVDQWHLPGRRQLPGGLRLPGRRHPRRRHSRARRTIRRMFPARSGWHERWLLIRLGRALAREPADRYILDAMGKSDRPPIEQIASDLRRLGRHRLGLATRNPVWHEAVRQAYDDRLRLACGCLGIQQHMSELEGLDLEIERVRVEGELHAAGLYFGGTDAERRPGPGRDRR